MLVGVSAASGDSGDYAGSNAGVVNVQASTTPLTLPCPADAPWNRDPDVCAHRWSTIANDKSESDLAVDPTNPNHIVGMSKAFFSPKDYLFELVWYDSTDGGKHWTSGILPGYEGWMDTTDPTIAFDSEGNLYALVLPFNFVIEPNGDHNWSVGHVSPERLNDGIYLSRSLKSDGPVGQKWQPPVELATYHSSGLGITADKQWVGADTFGKHPGSVYASWIVFDGSALNTVFAVSNDFGEHFSAPRVMSQATKPKFNGDPYVFEGPEGNVYVSYDTLPPHQSYTTGGFQVVVSHDNGRTFSKPGQQVTTSVGPTPYAPDTFRDGTPYSMTVNPANGHLLLAYENYDRSVPRGNVWLTQSGDEGKTWAEPVQANDSAAAGDTTQQKVFAAPNGLFAVAFYDRRLACPATDPIANNIGRTNTCIDTTIQFYNPDGTARGGNRRVTQETWDPNVNPPQQGGLSGTGTFIGDYFGGAMTSTASGALAHLLFVSTSPALQLNAVPGGGLTPPYQQQVYAQVPAPLAPVQHVNRAPAAFNSSLATNEDTRLGLTLQASDPDADSLSYTIVSGPAHGSLSGSGASRTYTPAAGFHGTDTFTFRASDGQLNSNVATVSVAVRHVNHAPVAQSGSFATSQNTSLAVTLRASDPDGDSLDYTIVAGPAHGSLSGSGAARTYTPDGGYSGSDSFTFKASDGQLNSNVATVSILVASVLQPPLVPIPQKTAVIAPLKGRVLIQRKRGGPFVRLTHAESVPLGRVLDVSKGSLRMKVAKNRRGGISKLVVTGGQFSSKQNETLLTTLRLRGGNFGVCGKRVLAGSGPPRKAGGASVRHLASSGKGRFRTKGRYSSSTVKGTSWITDDRCSGTLTYVKRGTVSVFDFILKRTVIVKRGQSYLARPRARP